MMHLTGVALVSTKRGRCKGDGSLSRHIPVSKAIQAERAKNCPRTVSN
jgi:hypothetical protein